MLYERYIVADRLTERCDGEVTIKLCAHCSCSLPMLSFTPGFSTPAFSTSAGSCRYFQFPIFHYILSAPYTIVTMLSKVFFLINVIDISCRQIFHVALNSPYIVFGGQDPQGELSTFPSTFMKQNKSLPVKQFWLRTPLNQGIFQDLEFGGVSQVMEFNLPFPLLFPSPPFFFLFSQLGGQASAVSSPTKLGLRQSPSRNRIWCILALQFGIWWQQL